MGSENWRAVVGRIGVVWHEFGGACVEGHDAVTEKGIRAQAACNARYDAEHAFAGGYASEFGWGADCVHLGGYSVRGFAQASKRGFWGPIG